MTYDLKNFDAEKAKKAVVEWIRNWFEENGKDCNAVIGVSGGKDSSVVAALCVEAIGADRVIGVIMPDRIQDDIEDAYDLINHLNIKKYVLNIGETAECILLQMILTCRDIEISEQTKTNLPARIRMATLYAVSQSVNGRVANTSNLSEDYIGYTTKYGDSAGDFAPLKGFTSEEVVMIGKACGLPYRLLHKTPADGLCGIPDEASFGFSYKTLNSYIMGKDIKDKAVKDKIEQLHRQNLFKEQPIETFTFDRERFYE